MSSYSGENFEGVVNLPIVDDTLLMRAGMQYFDRNGFTDDVSTGSSLDNKHYWTAAPRAHLAASGGNRKLSARLLHIQ